MANDQERAAFEAWARRARGFSDRYLAQQPDGYENEVVEASWVGWQAGRAALAAAPVQAVPEAELEALRKDAERYRWLRDGQNWPAVFGGHDEPEPLRGAHLDAAIDAELALHNAKLTGEAERSEL